MLDLTKSLEANSTPSRYEENFDAAYPKRFRSCKARIVAYSLRSKALAADVDHSLYRQQAA
jgi:hypothetical protein